MKNMDYKQLAEIIEKREIEEKYKSVVRQYTEKLIAESKSLNTVKGRVTLCFQAAEWLKGREWSVLREETAFNSLIVSYKQRGIKDSTISFVVISFKGFLGWLFAENPPKYLEGLKPRKIRKDLVETQLLTPLEIKAIVEKAINIRDKAFVMALYESATRISELLNMKIRDVEFRPQETVITITQSKTLKRKIPLFDSTPYLINWLNNHPYKNDPEAYVFMVLASNYYGRKMWPGNAGYLLRTFAKRAGIKKKVYPHLLRHSRLTWLAKVEKLNERDLRLLAGWSENSNMPNTYLHYGFDGVVEKMKFNRGILNTEQIEREHEKQALLPVKCPRCERINPADSAFCNCGMALSMKAHLQIEEIKKKEEELHTAIMNKGTEGIDTKGKDVKEVMYQIVKSNPMLLEKLNEIVNF